MNWPAQLAELGQAFSWLAWPLVALFLFLTLRLLMPRFDRLLVVLNSALHRLILETKSVRIDLRGRQDRKAGFWGHR